MATALDVENMIDPNRLASTVAAKWDEWNGLRAGWLAEKVELNKFVFARDTTTTSVSKTGWSNSTTTPYICQIYDNLLANYSAAIFPRDQWFKFFPKDAKSAAAGKAKVVQSYMEAKAKESDLQTTVKDLLDDWVLYGNCFATVDYLREGNTLETGEQVRGYSGPKLIRISPYDIVFDPTVASFSASPKIVRSLLSIGQVAELAQDENSGFAEVFERMVENRRASASNSQQEKSAAFIADGFNSLESYYSSNLVEVLTYYGDLYDVDSGVVHYRSVIKVVDRAYVFQNKPIPTWLGKTPIYHSGWRKRPDNLYAMGPLDNLVGMQYRMDHLENMKADIWDLTAGPMTVNVGHGIEEYDIEPLGQINVGTEGSVSFLTPPPLALQADNQILLIQQKMEEIAGAPRSAMGFRTPGEKTKFEVQVLDGSANKVFTHKASQFQKDLLEQALMAMFEAALKEMTSVEIVASFDASVGMTFFEEITKEDITANGSFVALGARFHEEAGLRTQTLNQMIQVKTSAPDIGVHWSGRTIARLLAEQLNEPTLFTENVQVQEQLSTQKVLKDAEVDLQEDQEAKAELGL
tara:strand:+ start:2623 stop:4359 length:1737 start_codon:yes stop_codon:yes gene_type:complete